VTAATFLSRFRALNGDVYRSGDRVIFNAAPTLLDAVQWRLREIGKPALLEALRCEERSASARLTARQHPTSREHT
jgi:hypothetical protein